MEWALQNSGSLYMTLSEPCKDIMKAFKKRAFELVVDGTPEGLDCRPH
jgi:hypothetical protein